MSISYAPQKNAYKPFIQWSGFILSFHQMFRQAFGDPDEGYFEWLPDIERNFSNWYPWCRIHSSSSRLTALLFQRSEADNW